MSGYLYFSESILFFDLGKAEMKLESLQAFP